MLNETWTPTLITFNGHADRLVYMIQLIASTRMFVGHWSFFSKRAELNFVSNFFYLKVYIVFKKDQKLV